MENMPSRVEGLLSDIISKFADELEERYTSEGKVYFDPEDIESLRRGEKISNTERSLLVRIAQDFRLTPIETDELVDRIFLPEVSDDLNELAVEIESMKNGEDRVVDKLVAALRRGDKEGARLFCINEADKFSSYRTTILPLLVKKLFGGTGSPWSNVEKQVRKI